MKNGLHDDGHRWYDYWIWTNQESSLKQTMSIFYPFTVLQSYTCFYGISLGVDDSELHFFQEMTSFKIAFKTSLGTSKVDMIVIIFTQTIYTSMSLIFGVGLLGIWWLPSPWCSTIQWYKTTSIISNKWLIVKYIQLKQQSKTVDDISRISIHKWLKIGKPKHGVIATPDDMIYQLETFLTCQVQSLK